MVEKGRGDGCKGEERFGENNWVIGQRPKGKKKGGRRRNYGRDEIVLIG